MSVFCENIPPQIAGIGLSYLCGHFYLGISFLGAGCVPCLGGRRGYRHQDGLFLIWCPFLQKQTTRKKFKHGAVFRKLLAQL